MSLTSIIVPMSKSRKCAMSRLKFFGDNFLPNQMYNFSPKLDSIPTKRRKRNDTTRKVAMEKSINSFGEKLRVF